MATTQCVSFRFAEEIKMRFQPSGQRGGFPLRKKRKAAVRLKLKAPRLRHSNKIGQFFAADYFWLGDRTGDLAAASGGRGPNGRKPVYSAVTGRNAPRGPISSPVCGAPRATLNISYFALTLQPGLSSPARLGPYRLQAVRLTYMSRST